MFLILIKTLNTRLFYACSLSTSYVSGLVLSARYVILWSLQSNEGRDTVTLRHNCNKGKVHNAKSAWPKWEAPDRSSLKVVIPEGGEDLIE